MSPRKLKRSSTLHFPSLGARRSRALTRRRFLQASTAALSGIALANCRPQIADPNGESSATSDGKLHIYTWANYTDDQLTARFQEETGIEVVVDVYDSNEVMLAKLLAGGGDAYSVIYPSGFFVQEMVDKDLVAPLEQERIPSLQDLFEKWQNPEYDPSNTYSVPMSWGTTGLIYNSELLDTAPQDWNYLWDNQDLLSGKITLLADVREVMGAALKSLGYSYNATDAEEIQAAYEKLVELKPAIANFTTTDWLNQLLAGDLLISMGYSPDALFVSSENPALKYLIPESGSSVWTDTMVIPQNAPNPDAAYAWINFMMTPEVAAATSERLFFATPSQAVFEQLSEESKTNADLFPPQEVVNRCEDVILLEEATNQLYADLWTELTST